jgi:hypothetical protein
MKTRSSSGVGQKVDLAFDPDTLRITDCDEAEEDGNPQGGRSRIADSIKARTTVKSDEDPIKEVAKVRAQTGGSKLRELLNNVNREDEI